MDWYLEADSDATQATALRHEIVSFLERHASEGSDLDAAGVIVAELIANAVRHTGGPVWATVDWSHREPTLIVRDLGPGFRLPDDPHLPPMESVGGRGLYIASQLAPELAQRTERSVGADVRATLPVTRETEVSIDPTRHVLPSLPDAAEAGPDGTFGRESFLRALVVQLATSLEETQGPAAAQAAVAQVGTDVGARMEDAYRKANRLDGPLDVEQTADLYVGLKNAIGGRFRVTERHADRIVLTTDACPFGDVVRRSPSLCRMTSSVFGGIAARNVRGAAVQLEERIAVGDPGCRVVVWLEEPPNSQRELVHVYRARAGD
ncbi:MAG TPA: methanogen output domain 1-containing protein [Actinomycetota bacterium]|nr:methanogen output domain 1-containing protein [Actinomycetota bacterium]